MIPKRMVMFVLLAGMICWGCSSGRPASGGRWTAQPASAVKQIPQARVTLTPRQGEFDYFTAFELTVANTGAHDLHIDWNASRYEFNRKPQGVLVFEGIDPAAIKTASVPPDTVPPGSVFSRLVMPMRTIAWSPIKEKTRHRPAITPGMLPAGVNGIRLVFHHAEGKLTIPLTVRIFREAQI